MRSKHIVDDLDVGASAWVNAGDSPFHQGNEVVAIVNITHAGGDREWTIEGNNAPDGETPVVESLAPESSGEHSDYYTITMPRQIRLNTTSGSTGNRHASLHLLGGT